MKLQQLRFIREVAAHNLSVSAAADALFTSQPGVSKQIRLLEEELGVLIFERNGKQLTQITEPGQRILELAERMLQDSDNIRLAAEEFRNENSGTLTIGTTHTQARYTLPPAIKAFRQRYPRVSLHIHQGTPQQIADWAAKGEVDFAIATEAMHLFDELALLPCYRWNRCILATPDHPLAAIDTLTLADIAKHPLITYVFGFTGRSKLDQAFLQHGLKADVVLTAVDADVIKTYVRLGLGIGIVANMAYEPQQDEDLVALSASHLFEPSTTNIGFRRNRYLRAYMIDFMRLFAPHLSLDIIAKAAELKPDSLERAKLLEDMKQNLPEW